ncbi:MAG: peptide-methionine (S)-S-oxide reductase MsrA [Deltaproteobacteria bacterium]|jgi:peptide-methionine (S)-S-oxide reductase
MRSLALLTFTAALFTASACVQQAAAKTLPKPKQDVAAKGETAKAVFAAGCFWCVEAVFERVEGVKSVVSGYAGDSKENADYKKVSSGITQHAEVVEITYDPQKVTFGQLLQVLFTTHDPTTLNRQGPDRGTQYRSAVFYADEEQKKVAAAYIEQINDKYFGGGIVTKLERLAKFFPAEAYHQDFVRLHPDHGYVRMWVPAKLEKLEKAYPEVLKKGA